MNDEDFIVCECDGCGQKNRVIIERLHQAICGKCGQDISGEALDAMEYEDNEGFYDDSTVEEPQESN